MQMSLFAYLTLLQCLRNLNRLLRTFVLEETSHHCYVGLTAAISEALGEIRNFLVNLWIL